MEWICGNGIAKIGRKKNLLQSVCSNAITEIGGEFVAIVAMPLPKMGGKKIVVAEIWEGIKKKVSRLQYFYNKSHVISY